MPIISETIWDGGATVWDGGATRWDVVLDETEIERAIMGGSKGADAVIDAMLERRDRFALRFVNFLVSSEFLEKES